MRLAGGTLGAGAYSLARLSEGQTCYRRYGFEENPGAAVMVLIHGATVPSPVFEPMARLAVEQEGLRVLTYDYFSRGYSDRETSQATAGSLALLSTQLKELLEHLGLEAPSTRVVLLGLSYGGAIAAHYASLYPSSISAIVAGCPFVENTGRQLSLVRTILSLVPDGYFGTALADRWRAFAFRYMVVPAMRRRVAASLEASVSSKDIGSKDITLEIANQEKIKNSEKDLRLILNSLPIGVYILDREGKPFYTNNFTHVCKMF